MIKTPSTQPIDPPAGIRNRERSRRDSGWVHIGEVLDEVMDDLKRRSGRTEDPLLRNTNTTPHS